MRKYGVALTVIVSLGASVAVAQTVTLPCDTGKRIKAKISQDAMNRIRVENDRIVHVFGDSEAYAIQTDETSGQIFIKPTLENGDKPLSLTLITESQLTQDLTLEPSPMEAATVILNNPHGRGPHAQGDKPLASFPLPGDFQEGPYSRNALSREGRLVKAMTLLASGQGVPVALAEPPMREKPGLCVTFKQGYLLGRLQGFHFQVQNTSELPMAVEDRDFYQRGDLALHVAKSLMAPGERVDLYVVRL